MHAISTDMATALRGSPTIHTRMQLLDESDQAIDELSGEDGYLIDAQLTMDRTRHPRHMVNNLTIANPNGVWTPRSLAGELWIRKRFQIDYGVQLPSSSIEWVTLGRFLIDRPRVQFPEEALTLQASDYWKLGHKRKLRQTVTLEKGTRLEDVVLRLGLLAGFTAERMRLNDSDVVLAAHIILPFGADVLQELTRVVEEHDHEVYADWDGWLTLRHAPRLCAGAECRSSEAHLGGLDEDAEAFPITTGEDAVLLAVTKDWNDDQLYNAVIVVAEGAQRLTVSAEARDLNPYSPAYNPVPGTDPAWPNGGPLGDRLLPVHYTARLADEFACYQLAQRFLFENSLVEEAYDLTLATQPQLMPGDLVALDHAESDSDALVLIDAISFGTSVESDQSLAIKQLRWLSPVV